MRKEIIIALFIITFGKLLEQRLFLSEDLETAYNILDTPNSCKSAFPLRHFLMSQSAFRTKPHLQSAQLWHIKADWFEESKKEESDGLTQHRPLLRAPQKGQQLPGSVTFIIP